MSSKDEVVVTEYELAINLFDIDNLSEDLRSKFLSGKLDISNAIKTFRYKDPTERAVVFTCDNLTAALACDMIRSENRREDKPPTRVYIRNKSKDTWKKIPIDVPLTTLNQEGKAELNKDVFKQPIAKYQPFDPVEVFKI